MYVLSTLTLALCFLFWKELRANNFKKSDSTSIDYVKMIPRLPEMIKEFQLNSIPARGYDLHITCSEVGQPNKNILCA